MGIFHRKLLHMPQITSHSASRYYNNGSYYFAHYDSIPPMQKRLPLPPPLHQYTNVFNTKTTSPISPMISLLFCFLAGIIVLFCYIVFLKKYNGYSNHHRRRRNAFDIGRNLDFLNENHGPEFVHPIWMMSSMGLQQSVIDSIAIFKYKRDEGLTEGTECSVCLSEFEENESLRLLPKCSHAFHVPCIDIWLMSHKTCPICRAPIMMDTNVAHVSESDINLEENNDNNNGEELHQHTGECSGETSEMRTKAEHSSSLTLSNVQENDDGTRNLCEK